MPVRGFSSSEDDMRFAFGRSMYLAAAWMIALGVILLAMPSRRFATASWTFINEMPGGDDTLGVVYVVLGVAMMGALWKGRQRCVAVAWGWPGWPAGASGCSFWSVPSKGRPAGSVARWCSTPALTCCRPRSRCGTATKTVPGKDRDE